MCVFVQSADNVMTVAQIDLSSVRICVCRCTCVCVYVFVYVYVYVYVCMYISCTRADNLMRLRGSYD